MKVRMKMKIGRADQARIAYWPGLGPRQGQGQGWGQEQGERREGGDTHHCPATHLLLPREHIRVVMMVTAMTIVGRDLAPNPGHAQVPMRMENIAGAMGVVAVAVVAVRAIKNYARGCSRSDCRRAFEFR